MEKILVDSKIMLIFLNFTFTSYNKSKSFVCHSNELHEQNVYHQDGSTDDDNTPRKTAKLKCFRKNNFSKRYNQLTQLISQTK